MQLLLSDFPERFVAGTRRFFAEELPIPGAKFMTTRYPSQPNAILSCESRKPGVWVVPAGPKKPQVSTAKPGAPASALADARTCPTRLVGYVVMPEHVHLLISEPAQGSPSTMLQALKQRVSRDLLATVRFPPARTAGGAHTRLPHFWQPRFHDFNVHSAKKRREKLDYMHANPVKRKLVKNPSAWLWSSASFYASGIPGMIPIDPVP